METGASSSFSALSVLRVSRQTLYLRRPVASPSGDTHHSRSCPENPAQLWPSPNEPSMAVLAAAAAAHAAAAGTPSSAMSCSAVTVNKTSSPSPRALVMLQGAKPAAVGTSSARLQLGRAVEGPQHAARAPARAALSDGNGAAAGEDKSAVDGVHELSLSTQILHFKSDRTDPYGASSTPIYQTATFKLPSATDGAEYDYSRSGNPTRHQLEQLLANIEGAEKAFAFSSGMAALSAATRLVSTGQEILAGDDMYGGTDRLLSQVAPRAGISVRRVDTVDLDAVAAAITPATRLVMLESPTNPRQRISDIRAISELAHKVGALVLVDNSIMSPALSRPLDLGADIVMHSATKFLSGHADVMAGVLAVKGEQLARDVYFLQNAEGSGLSPMDSWLVLRGVKTMALRIERQQASAQKIAEFLASHPAVKQVYYAGLPHHPGHDLHFAQAKGAGSVFSFTTGSLAASKHIVESAKLASVTVSFGSVTTSLSLPCFMSHASIPAHVREERGLVEDLVRISVGIEDVNDLLQDLRQALDSIPAAVSSESAAAAAAAAAAASTAV